MLHLVIGTVIMIGITHFIINMLILAVRFAWLGVLLVALCVMAAVTGVLAMIVGVQWLSQVVSDWRWQRKYGEIFLPPFDD
jgi:hypothetical protein